MAKMGGWSILDYGLNYAEIPWDWLQLGYASYLSSWALMNSGNEQSDYGFWYPGKENDGAMGWAFMSSKFGRAWIRKDMPRGAWYYDGEADLGLGASFRMAQTILAEDPLFGWTVYGGTCSMNDTSFSIIPRDGVRRKLSLISEDKRIIVTLERDGFKEEHPVVVSKNFNNLLIPIESRHEIPHEAVLTIESGPACDYTMSLNREKIKIHSNGNGSASANLHIAPGDNILEISMIKD